MYAAALAKFGTTPDEPYILTQGTEVSAKYKGAFCEATIKRVDRHIRVKIVLPDNSNTTINEESILAQPQGVVLGAEIELRWNGNRAKAAVQKIMDCSYYTVVFDDGDETTLRRSSLCLKSGKHYSDYESLDKLPLTNPEHVIYDTTSGRRSRRPRYGNARNAGSPSANVRKTNKPKGSQSDSDDDNSNSSGSRFMRTPKVPLSHPDVGKVICAEHRDKRTYRNKESWFPALIESLHTESKDISKDSKEVEFKVRNFCDERIYVVAKSDARLFDREVLSHCYTYEWSRELRRGINKALTYLATHAEDGDSNKYKLFESSGEDFSDSDIESDDENFEDAQERQRRQQKQNEERDMFVAKLYKFMDERGTPINSCPTVNGVELNLYKLYRIVHKMGGPNKVTNRNVWNKVYNYLGLHNFETEDDANDFNDAIAKLKSVYETYLHPFHELNRKLGPAPALVDSRMARSMSRPSRGERKREEERSRLNSVSSVTNSNSKPTRPSRVLATPNSKTEKETNKIKNNEISDNESNKPSTSVDPSTSTKQLTEQSVPSTSNKSDDKKRRKKETEPDSVRLEKQSKDDTENDDSQMTGSSSLVDGESDDEDSNGKMQIKIGDGISVLYGRGKQVKMYDAKVVKMRMDQGEEEYFVHYYGWSTRYDEWITMDRITKVLHDKSLRRRSGKTKNKGEPLVTEESGEEESIIQRTRKASIKSEPVKEPENQKRPRSSDVSKADNSSLKTRGSSASERNDNDKRGRSNSKEDAKEARSSTSKAKAIVETDLPRPQRVRTSSYSQKEYSSRKEKPSIKVEEKEKNRREERESRKTKNSSDAAVSSSKAKSVKTPKKTETHSSNKEPEEEPSRSKREKRKETERTSEVSVKKEKPVRESHASKRNLDAELSKVASHKAESSSTPAGNKKKRGEEPVIKPPSVDTTDKPKPSKLSLKDQVITEEIEDKVKVQPQPSTSQQTAVKSCTILDLAPKSEETTTPESNEPSEVRPITPEVNEVKEEEKEKEMEIEKEKEEEEEKTEKTEEVPPASPLPEAEDLPPSDDNHTESEEPLSEPCVSKPTELEQTSSNLSASNSSLPVGEEDLEVQSILCKDRPIDLQLSESNDYYPSSNIEASTDNAVEANDDSSSDRDSPGPLVMADEDDENSDKMEEVKSETDKTAATSETDEAVVEKEQEMVGPQTEPEEEEALKESESVDSLLLCEETVPASPPPTPPPFTFAHQESCSLRDSTERFGYLTNSDQYSTLNISNQAISLGRRNSPVVTDSNDDDDDDDDDLDGAAGVEADVDEGEDEDNNDRPMTRKARSTERKRRNLRNASKANSSSSQSVSALLSSQDSSQEGDYHNEKHHKSTDKMSSKRSMPAENKNDEDSSSESHNRGDQDHACSPSSSKKRRRGRMRTTSQSETANTSIQNSFTKESRSSLGKTRAARCRNNSGHSQNEYIPFHNGQSETNNNESLFPHFNFESSSPIMYQSTFLANYIPPKPKCVDYTPMLTYKPRSKFNFVTPLDLSLPCEEKTRILMERLQEMRRIFHDTKRKRTALERKKRKAAKKLKEMEKKSNEKRSSGDSQQSKGGLSQSGSDSSSSSSQNERISRSRLAALSRVARNEHELQNDERLAAAALGDLGSR